MKRIITILCAGMLTIGLSAQTESGTILLEGGSNMSYTSMKLNKVTFDGEDVTPDEIDATNKMSVNLGGGYFMMDGLAAGLLFDYSSSSTGDVSSNTMLVGPMVRYYIGESGMWGQLSYGIGSSSDGNDDTDEPTSSALGFGAGYAVMLSDNVSLSPSLGYSMVTATQEEGDVDVVMKAGGLVFSVGISVYLGN